MLATLRTTDIRRVQAALALARSLREDLQCLVELLVDERPGALVRGISASPRVLLFGGFLVFGLRFGLWLRLVARRRLGFLGLEGRGRRLAVTLGGGFLVAVAAGDEPTDELAGGQA